MNNEHAKTIANYIKNISQIIQEAFNKMYEVDYISYVLYIGRASIMPGLKALTGTDCVIDNLIDIFNDETRTKFYLRYLRRNYSKDGFCYYGDSGIDDLHVELMIYAHLWDSHYFLKSLTRLASIVSGKGYIWDAQVNWWRKEKKMQDCIIIPIKNSGLELGNLLEQCYRHEIRNAFAHSQYSIDASRRLICIRTDEGILTLKFDEFQEIFLKSVILMNKMENLLERNHDAAAQMQTPITDVFKTPDGLPVQVYGEMVKRGKTLCPEFRLVRVKEDD